jgi:hypothetical protein
MPTDSDDFSTAEIEAAEIVALRYLLALAREDRLAAEDVRRDMSRFEPGLFIGVLASSMIDFMSAISNDTGAGAVSLIEWWLQSGLDRQGGPP